MVANPRFALKRGRDSYLSLVQAFPLASLKSETHYEAAQGVVDQLVAKGPLDKGEELYLDALTDLIGTYEDVHHPIEAASDADLLRHFLEAKGVSQAEVSRDTGLSKSSLSEVLSGKKPFSRRMIRMLAGYFNVPVGVLVSNI